MRGEIAFVALNRPEVGNALDLNLASELSAVLDDVNQNGSIRVVILTGNGTSFCAGGDVRYLLGTVSEQPGVEVRDFLISLGKPFMKLRELNQPVIAAVNGPAVGAGFDLLLHCDFRIASQTAVMGPT